MTTEATLRLCDEIIARCERSTDTVKLCDYIVKTIEARHARKGR